MEIKRSVSKTEDFFNNDNNNKALIIIWIAKTTHYKRISYYHLIIKNQTDTHVDGSFSFSAIFVDTVKRKESEIQCDSSSISQNQTLTSSFQFLQHFLLKSVIQLWSEVILPSPTTP